MKWRYEEGSYDLGKKQYHTERIHGSDGGTALEAYHINDTQWLP
jgi:hypothetical protein